MASSNTTVSATGTGGATPPATARGTRPVTAWATATAAALAAMVAFVASAAGIGVPASHVAHVAVDETQYVLTALSLWEDGDLDIADELAVGRWRDFADRPPAVQTEVLAGGRQVSPHDPLLPVLLAVPVGVGGWVGAKVALALVAAATAALTVWVAVRRFAVPVPLAGAGTALLAATAPLSVYGQQIYPELPAALAALAGVAALTASAMAPASTLWRRDLVLVAAVVALPWFGVKYVPVAAALAAACLVRALRAGRRRAALAITVSLAVAGAGYLLVHRLVWGGWTVYASGDHFRSTGEFSVVGVTPDYADRTVRLVGLLVDREFGLVGWQPAWLLLVPAAGALLRMRQWTLLAVVAAGWATATWVALTMHGYWWPGRQVVVVLPVALVGLLAWLARSSPRLVAAAGVMGAAGLWTYVLVLRAGWGEQLSWVFDFATVQAPAYRLLRPLLPDYRAAGVPAAHLVWVAVVLGLVYLGWCSAARQPGRRPAPVTEREHAC
jgi:hypothetical protein